MHPATRSALSYLARRRRIRIESGYLKTEIGTIPENREHYIACSRATLRRWLANGWIERVASPDRPPCNAMFKATKTLRAQLKSSKGKQTESLLA